MEKHSYHIIVYTKTVFREFSADNILKNDRGHYLHGANAAEMRRESREVLPDDRFDAFRHLHSNGMI